MAFTVSSLDGDYGTYDSRSLKRLKKNRRINMVIPSLKQLAARQTAKYLDFDNFQEFLENRIIDNKTIRYVYTHRGSYQKQAISEAIKDQHIGWSRMKLLRRLSTHAGQLFFVGRIPLHLPNHRWVAESHRYLIEHPQSTEVFEMVTFVNDYRYNYYMLRTRPTRNNVHYMPDTIYLITVVHDDIQHFQIMQ